MALGHVVDEEPIKLLPGGTTWPGQPATPQHNSTLQANGAKAGANWEPSVYLHWLDERELVVV